MRKTIPECIEGPEAFARFDAAVTALLAVPRSVLVRKLKAHRRKVDKNPNRRGPKRKVKTSPSPEGGV